MYLNSWSSVGDNTLEGDRISATCDLSGGNSPLEVILTSELRFLWPTLGVYYVSPAQAPAVSDSCSSSLL